MLSRGLRGEDKRDMLAEIVSTNCEDDLLGPDIYMNQIL